jgi:tetratricopeptide (TPR) repeat protein
MKLNKIILLSVIVLSNFSFGQTTKDSLLMTLRNHPQKDTVRCNILRDYVELEEDETIWPKYNLELKNLLLEILKNKTLQQTKKDWYVKKIITAILYEAQDVLRTTSNYKKTLELQYSIIRYAQSINYIEGVALAYNEIADCYVKQKKFNQAKIFFLKNEEIYLKRANEKELATTYNNLGQLHIWMKENDLALEYLNKCLQIKQKIKSETISVTINNIGTLYLSQKDYEKSLIYFQKALKLNREIGVERYICRNLYNISKVYLETNQLKLAEKNAIEGYAIAKKVNFISEIELEAKLLSEIYEKQNNSFNALEYYKIHIKFKDSIQNNQNKEELLKSDFKYETEKKEAKIKELNQKKRIAELQSNKKTILINSFIISFLALAMIAYFLFSRFKTQKKNELLETKLAEAEKLLEAEKKATESELKALKSQMNPHFIFNALNSIQEQFMYGDKLKGNEQLSNFTYLTRQILEVSGKKQITIATEIDILTKYLDLEKMRFAKDFEYTISTSEAIDEDYHKLPPMLLQPFIENSIKHGLMHKKGFKTISIDFDLDENEEYIICTIIDNGIGRTKSAEIKAKNQSKHRSFSTESIAQRLELLNENHSIKQLITYSDELENDEIVGTKVVVNIPLG